MPTKQKLNNFYYARVKQIIKAVIISVVPKVLVEDKF